MQFARMSSFAPRKNAISRTGYEKIDAIWRIAMTESISRSCSEFYGGRLGRISIAAISSGGLWFWPPIYFSLLPSALVGP